MSKPKPKDEVDHWVQRHVNDFCAQTGQNTVHFETLKDLLLEIDSTKAAIAFIRYGSSTLRPGPVEVE